MIVGGVLGVGVLLILILVPMSFVGLEYYEMGFRRSKSTGSVNVDHVYEFGKHFIGPDGDFKVFPASALFETYTGITVFSADRWAVLCEKVPNVLSRCHTKRRTGARGRAHPSFGMTPTQAIRDLFALRYPVVKCQVPQ